MSSRDALNSLEARWQELGVSTESLLPGLARRDVDARLVNAGVAPHPALLDWFAWHDGSDEMYWSAVPTPLAPLPLDQALTRRNSFLAAEDLQFVFSPAWLPILGGPSADTIVLDSATGELLRADPWNAEAPLRRSGHTLESAVAFFLTVLATVPLDFSTGDAEVDFGLLPPALQDSPLL